MYEFNSSITRKYLVFWRQINLHWEVMFPKKYLCFFSKKKISEYQVLKAEFLKFLNEKVRKYIQFKCCTFLYLGALKKNKNLLGW